MPSDYFPLQKGSCWTYAAHVEWTVPNTTPRRIEKADISWKTEVVDLFEKYSLVAARFRGFVTDLSWYEPEREPSDSIVVKIGPTHYYHITKDVETAWQEIVQSGGGSYLKCLENSEPLLEAPLIKDARFGEVTQTPRETYCYFVDAAEPFDPTPIHGAPVIDSPMQYTITFRTNPDHSKLGFVPQLGIVYYLYRHHGTTANAEARLVEYKK